MSQQTSQYLYDENHPPLIVNDNYRKIYIGTHGRGFWVSTSLTGLEDKHNENKQEKKKVAQTYFKIYPNPVSSNATIDIDLKSDQKTTIEIYDLNGKRVNSLHNGLLKQGRNKINFDVSALENGTYIAAMKTSDEVKVSKFLVIK